MAVGSGVLRGINQFMCMSVSLRRTTSVFCNIKSRSLVELGGPVTSLLGRTPWRDVSLGVVSIKDPGVYVGVVERLCTEPRGVGLFSFVQFFEGGVMTYFKIVCRCNGLVPSSCL